MLKEIRVDWEVFNFKVHCVIGPHHLLKAYIKKRQGRVYKAKATADLGGLYFRSLPKKGGVIWLSETPRTPVQIGYLAHEVGHAVMDMLTQRSINIDMFNDETLCYSIAHGVEAILRECK